MSLNNSVHALRTSALQKINLKCLVVIIVLLIMPAAFADALDEKVYTRIYQFAADQSAKKNEGPKQALQNVEILTDSVIDQENTGTFKKVLFRDDEVNDLMDALSRDQNKYPVIMGEVGSGKSSIVNLLADRIVTQKIPGGIHLEELGDAVIFRTSARAFAIDDGPKGMDFRFFLDSVNFIGKQLNLKIIVDITQPQYLKMYHTTILSELASSPNRVPVIIEADFKTYSNNLNSTGSLGRMLVPISAEELTKDQVTGLLQSTKGDIKSRYGVTISDEIITAAVSVAADYRRDIHEPARSLQLIEDFAIQQSRLSGGYNARPAKTDLFKFVAQKMGVPVVPQDEEAFTAYMESLRAGLKEDVVAQDQIIDGLVDQFRTALTSSTKQHSIAMIMGSTGVGKTYVAERIGYRFYKSDSRVLEIDMTQFSDEHKANVLFGAGNGYMSADTDKGVICEFLDGRGKGGGVIILNELEKAHSEIITRMMELFDKGEIRCGDGQVRYLGRSLIVMTSNKNTDQIFPYDVMRGMTPAERDSRIAKITQEDLKKAFTQKSSYTEDDSHVITQPVVERVNRFYFAGPLLNDDAEHVAQKEIAKYIKNFESQGERKLIVEPSFAQTITGAFYNESNGARQINNAVEQSLSRVIQEYKKKYGYGAKEYTVTAAIHPTVKTKSFITITDPATGNTLTIDGPQIPVDNKLLDPQFRSNLINLGPNLKKEIFGQDEAVDTVVSVIQARFLKAGKQQPASGFFIGTTGTGKSQIAKSTAKYLFNREDAVEMFEMGRVETSTELGNIFNPPKGIIGSDQPGQFERFLMRFPEGGVLLFDEMSNVGGNNLSLKNAIFKQFYQMLEEGSYTSPATGKKYDLGKYIFLFTGNDGENEFKGMTSDATLDDIYKDLIVSPEKVKDILRNSGVPDAFLGRLGFVSLMRPTKSEIKTLVAKKIVGAWVKEVTSAQPVDIKYDDAFITEVGGLLYSPKSGARSIKHFIDRVLGKAIGNEVLKLDFDRLIGNGERATINVSLAVQKPEKPFYEGNEPDKREAILKVDVIQPGAAPNHIEAEFTQDAYFNPQLHIDQARATAYHEMGHAVTSFTDFTGLKVTRITIVPETIGDLTAAGVTFYKKVQTRYDQNWDVLVKRVANLLGGSEAETIFRNAGDLRNMGRSNDVMKAGQTIRRALLGGHLLPELDGAAAYIDKDGNLLPTTPDNWRQKIDSNVDKILDQGRALAVKTINERKALIDAGVAVLMKKYTIGDKEYEALEAQYANTASPCAQILAQ
jgi:ATP-dependent Clp protease ATP-binding subunit ClpA